MVNASFYYSEFRGEKAQFVVKLQQYLPRDWKLSVVYRYRLPFVDDEDMKRLGKYFLYDQFRKRSEAEIRNAEKLCATPFNLMRNMSKVAFLRYPDMGNLPDDEFLANLAIGWSRFFRENRTDVFIIGLIDETPGIVGKEVAKRMGIPVVLMHGGKFSDSMYMCDGSYNYIFPRKLKGSGVEKGWKAAVECLTGKRIINPQMIKIASEDRNLLNIGSVARLMRAGVRNFYIYHFKVPAKDRKIWYSTGELVMRQLRYFIRARLSPNYFREKPPAGEKFVLFPLHYNDDASITAKFAIHSQYELIEKIAKVLPHDVWLHVKPHPHWRSSDMPLYWMRRLSKVPKVRLLAYDYDQGTRELVRKCEFMVIINSSMGMEALIAGKRVVAFGVDYPPEIIPRIKDVTELMDAAYNRQPRKEEVKKFVAHLYANSAFMKDEKFSRTAELGLDADVKGIIGLIVESYGAAKGKK